MSEYGFEIFIRIFKNVNLRFTILNLKYTYTLITTFYYTQKNYLPYNLKQIKNYLNMYLSDMTILLVS